LVFAALGVIAPITWYAFGIAREAQSATMNFRSDMLNQTKEVEVRLAVQAKGVQDNWEASQRQFLGLRNDITEVKAAIKEGDSKIDTQLSKQQDLLMKVLTNQDKK
jgi:hypothetical protein